MGISETEKQTIQKEFDYLGQQLQDAQLDALRAKNQYGQLSTTPFDENSELAKLQLDCDKQLDQIFHILSGHILEKDSKGGDKWVEPKDDRLRILTTTGVYLIMNELKMHVNPITILSNYKPEMIELITRDFGLRLNTLLFCKAEHFYHHPSPEQLYYKYRPLVVKFKLDIPDRELYEKCEEWSIQELRNKFTHHRMIVLGVTELVYSTYLRAMNGEERKRLREKQIFHTNQTIQPQQTPQKRGFFG